MRDVNSCATLGEGALCRFGHIEHALGISMSQRRAWDRFVECCEGIARDLDAADLETARRTHNQSMSLPCALRARAMRLEVERRRLCELIEDADLLFRSLSDEQQALADQLLKPLWTMLGLWRKPAR